MSIPAINPAVATPGVTPAQPARPVDSGTMDEHLARALNAHPEPEKPSGSGTAALSPEPVDHGSHISAKASPEGPGSVLGPDVAVPGRQTEQSLDKDMPVGESKLREALGAVAEQQRRLDEAIELARSGKTFSPQELLSLQARTHRLAFDLNLVSKVAEHISSGMKRTLETQL